MKKTQKIFSQSLCEFDKITNEDRISVNSIIHQLDEFSSQTLSAMKSRGRACILDVGSGAGIKSALLVNHLKRKLDIEITLDSFEPNLTQHSLLLQTYKDHRLDGTIYKKKFNTKYLTKKYDYIFFLHSLYQFARDSKGHIRSLKNLNEYLVMNGMCLFLHKSIDGDFERMKRELFPTFGKDLPVSTESIQQTLRKIKIPYKIGNNAPLIYNINPSEKAVEIAKKISFILNDTLDYAEASNDQLESIGNWMLKNSQCFNESQYLNIPDNIIFAYRING